MLALGSRGITHLALVAMEANERDPLVDFLTPVAKVCGTEAGIRASELGVQALGGYGYLSGYRPGSKPIVIVGLQQFTKEPMVSMP